MLSFDINQSLVPKEHRWSRTFLAKVAKAFSKALPDQTHGEVELSFVTDEQIRQLNRQYRHKDKVTDVLSFPEPNPELSKLLGQVLISYPQAVRQAEDADIELELADLLVHGLLHLLGYDHELASEADVMFRLQDKIVAEIL
jgi:probable rRNA maturation factor